MKAVQLTKEEQLAAFSYMFRTSCLRLLHPFMPFITEEAWRYLPHAGDALIVAAWPIADDELIDDEVEARMRAISRCRARDSQYAW